MVQSAKISKKDIIFQLGFLALGIAMLYYVVSKYPLEKIVETIESVKIWPILLVLVVSFIGHIVRTYRWKLMLDTTGETKFWNLLFSMQFGYIVSLAIPRIGEFFKCFTTAETEKKPVSFVFGTIMAERIVDFGFLIFFAALAFAFKSDFISKFWDSIKANQSDSGSSDKLMMIVGIVIVFILMYPMINKMTDGEKNERNLIDGMKTALNVQNKVGFWTSSFLIWIGYFLTSYLLFFCFSGTEMLGVTEGYLTTMGGVVSRMLPINGGGIGAYHFVVENLLKSLGVEGLVGASYAILNHGLQFAFTLVTGAIAIFFLTKKVDLKNITNLKV